MDKNDIAAARRAFDIGGGTGILEAVSEAIALRPPTLVFPVANFNTLQSCGWQGEGAPMAALRTCHVCSVTTCARDIFAIEKEEGRLAGELIGAEIAPACVTDAREEPRMLAIDAPLGKGVWLVLLTSSRKAPQVWKGGAAVAGKPRNEALASVQFGDLRSKERRRGR